MNIIRHSALVSLGTGAFASWLQLFVGQIIPHTPWFSSGAGATISFFAAVLKIRPLFFFYGVGLELVGELLPYFLKGNDADAITAIFSAPVLFCWAYGVTGCFFGVGAFVRICCESKSEL